MKGPGRLVAVLLILHLYVGKAARDEDEALAEYLRELEAEAERERAEEVG